VSWPDFVDWRRETTAFDRLAASRISQFTLTGSDQATRIPGRRVTSEFFPALGVTPTAGRGFTPDDDRPDALAVAIITESLRRELGPERAAIGQVLDLDGRGFVIVGVLPPTFKYLRECDVFVANGPFVTDGAMRERFNHSGYFVLGRLRAGLTLDEARRELSAIQARINHDHPDGGGARVELQPLAARLVGDLRQTLFVLLGAVSLLLLIACGNVANLLMSRSSGRTQEVAVREALGAGRFRVIRQLLTESLVISVTGGIAGIGLAVCLLRLLLAMAPVGTPRVDEVSLDAASLLFAVGAVLLVGGVFGMAPAFQAWALAPSAAVIRTPRSGAHGTSRRVRRTLIVSQVAFALTLLAGAGLMLRTMEQLAAVQSGFRSDHVLTMRLALQAGKWSDARRIAFIDNVLVRVRAMPGVASAGVTSSLPIDGSVWNNVFTIEGRPAPASHNDFPRTALAPTSAGYFETMEIRIVRGRRIDERDAATSEPVVVVNETLARRGWPGANPVGQRIKWGWPETPGTWRTVVGVAADVKLEGLTDPTPPQMYLPFTQVPDGDVALVVRTATTSNSMLPDVQRVIGDTDRDVAVYAARAMDRVLGDSVARERMSLLVLAVFAGVAIALAVIGLYAAVARTVTDRTHEIGVRLALGASRRDIMATVSREGVLMIVFGLVFGIVGAVIGSGLMRGLLFGVEPADPLTLIVAAIITAATAFGACYVPARKTTHVDPVASLRAD